MDSLHAHNNIPVCTYACEYESLINCWMGNLQVKALVSLHMVQIENNSAEFSRHSFAVKGVSQRK